jgi:quinol monooxygenase YgiN
MAMSAEYRAMVMLKAKTGHEKELLEFTLKVASQIRAVDGLEKLEVNQAVDDPGKIVLYYWWISPGHSDRYVAGPVYAEIMPVLKTLISEHMLVMNKNISG